MVIQVMSLFLFCPVDWLPTAGSMVCLFIYPDYGQVIHVLYVYMLVMCTFTVTIATCMKVLVACCSKTGQWEGLGMKPKLFNSTHLGLAARD